MEPRAGAPREWPLNRCNTMRVEDAALALGISRTHAYDSIRRGDLPAIKIGRAVRVTKAAVERLLEQAS